LVCGLHVVHFRAQVSSRRLLPSWLREGHNELRLVFICLLTFLSWLPQER
jgi:hypothetical protein